MMATPAEQRPNTACPTCPFCEKGFKRLGNHLPHCKERQGRDYSAYLSQKTLDKRSTTTKKFCPKCHRKFLRLDTHLKNSATCKSISNSGPATSIPVTSPQRVCPSTEPSTVTLEDTSELPSPTLPQHQLQHTPPNQPVPQPKPLLKLPSSQQDWCEANTFFSDVLVPSVLKENTPETKNRVLSEGIYAFFEQKYGIRQPKPSKQQRKRDKHERALRKVTQLKKNARKELRTAKALGLPSENIQPIAQTFFNLVREHSHLKRASQSSQKQTQMSKTRQSCHHHFWQFAKQLLDENSTNQPQPQPQFGEAEATSYFRGKCTTLTLNTSLN